MMKPQVSESAGAALVRRVREDMAAEQLEPDGREVELLAQAEALADRIAELEQTISKHGLTTISKGGLVRLHPAVTEVRQTRATLARVLANIQMRDDSKDPVKQRAAQASWRSRNAAKGRRACG